MEEKKYVYSCDTPGCQGTYEAPKASRRRYCDKCLAERVTKEKAA